MISFRADLKIMLAAQPVDFRKSVHTLSALVCDALRANGVVIYSILFNSTIQKNTAITYCPGTAPGNANGSASPYFFQASNQTALSQAFASIAKSLSNLRVSK